MLGGMSADTILQARRLMYGGGGSLYPGMTGGPADWLRKTGTTTGLTTGTGIVEFDLERVAKRLFAAHAPLRNEIPRVGLTGLGFGTLANWRAIINIQNTQVYGGVSEGKRGGQIQYQEKDFSATYVGMGLESFVNFEAEYAALGYDDILDTATVTLLQAMMVEEEKMLLYGNPVTGGIALGTAATPTVTDAGSSGSNFTATVQTVKCVALTPLGLILAGGAIAATNAAITQTIIDQTVRSNADGSTDTINGGHSIISAAGTVTPTAGHSVQAVVTGTKGAAAYAWFLAINGGATLYLTAITQIPKVVFAAGAGDNPNTGNQQSTFTGNGSDRSQNTLAFPGLITQAFATSGWATGGIFNTISALSPAAGGAYYNSLAAAPFTFTGNSVNELDTALQWLWNAYRIYADEIWVSGYQAMKLTNGITTAAAPTYRIELQNGQQRAVGGALVTQYINKFALGGATTLPIRVHPYLPDSWCFLNLKTITDKWPIANITVPSRVKARREYYSVAWPVTTRQRQYGVYVDEVLECYTPFAFGILTDIA